MGMRRLVKYNGKTYINMREACEALEIDYGFVMGIRHNKNLTKEEAIREVLEGSPEGKPSTPRKFVFRGEEFKSLAEACEQHQLSIEAVREHKKRKDFTNVEVLEYCLSNNIAMLNKCFFFRGKEYTSFKDACKKNNVSYQTVSDRKRREKISSKEALAKQLDKRIEFRGKTYDTLEAACKEWGITTPKVRERSKSKGVSKIEALAFYVDNLKKNSED